VRYSRENPKYAPGDVTRNRDYSLAVVPLESVVQIDN
jgi:hypothetical protein